MARGTNAQLAVVEYDRLQKLHRYSQKEAWKGIAELLLTCQVQIGKAWSAFHEVIVYRESNDFKLTKKGIPNTTLLKAEQLSAYLAQELGWSRNDLCSRIGTYWKHPSVVNLQQHNLVGHAFRSIVTEILKRYGAPGLTFEEEVSATKVFPGFPFKTRSKLSKIDILAFKGPAPVAMISARWRYRHDRVDFIDEAHAYTGAGARLYGGVPFFAVTGEFSAARIEKVLDNAPPASPSGPIAAGIHFHPELVTKGLGENGRMTQLKSLDWLISQTHTW